MSTEEIFEGNLNFVLHEASGLKDRTIGTPSVYVKVICGISLSWLCLNDQVVIMKADDTLVCDVKSKTRSGCNPKFEDEVVRVRNHLPSPQSDARTLLKSEAP